MIWYRRKLSNTSDLNLYIAYESIRKSHMNRSFKSLLIIMVALMLSGCGDVAEDGFTQAQLDAFIEEDYEDMLRKYALLDDYGKSAVDSVLRTEFKRAQEQGTLNSGQSISVSVRSKRKRE